MLTNIAAQSKNKQRVPSLRELLTSLWLICWMWLGFQKHLPNMIPTIANIITNHFCVFASKPSPVLIPFQFSVTEFRATFFLHDVLISPLFLQEQIHVPIYHPTPSQARLATQLTEEEQVRIAQRIGLIQHLPKGVYDPGRDGSEKKIRE